MNEGKNETRRIKLRKGRGRNVTNMQQRKEEKPRKGRTENIKQRREREREKSL